MQALLARILHDPTDLAARTVYADALGEQGDPRGELIAAQCALAAAGIDHPDDFADLDVSRAELVRLAAIAARADALIATHGERWIAALALPAHVRVRFRRGFPEAVELLLGADANAALAHLAARTPIAELVLGVGQKTRPTTLRHPGALRALAVYERARDWIAPFTAGMRLRRFRFHSQLGADVTTLPAVRDVVHLAIDHANPWSAATLIELATAFPAATLALRNASLADAEVRALVEGVPHLRGLDVGDNPLGLATLRRLVKLPALRHVGFAWHRHAPAVRAKTGPAIAAATAPLRSLHLGDSIDAAGLAAIAASPVGQTLRVLGVGRALADAARRTGMPELVVVNGAAVVPAG